MFDRHFFAARRLALGLSVPELADELLVATSTVYRWESGDNRPSLATLIRVSRSLCVPFLSLVIDDASEERRLAVEVDALLAKDVAADVA